MIHDHLLSDVTLGASRLVKLLNRA